jgi:hypothetical protein
MRIFEGGVQQRAQARHRALKKYLVRREIGVIEPHVMPLRHDHTERQKDDLEVVIRHWPRRLIRQRGDEVQRDQIDCAARRELLDIADEFLAETGADQKHSPERCRCRFQPGGRAKIPHDLVPPDKTAGIACQHPVTLDARRVPLAKRLVARGDCRVALVLNALKFVPKRPHDRRPPETADQELSQATSSASSVTRMDRAPRVPCAPGTSSKALRRWSDDRNATGGSRLPPRLRENQTSVLAPVRLVIRS